MARIFGCRRGCRCKKCLSLKYVLSLFTMIFQTSSRFAQLQEQKRGQVQPHIAAAAGAWAALGSSVLQHGQRRGSGRPAAVRLARGVRVHQLILFFVRCGDQGAGAFTHWITVPRLERRNTFDAKQLFLHSLICRAASNSKHVFTLESKSQA